MLGPLSYVQDLLKPPDEGVFVYRPGAWATPDVVEIVNQDEDRALTEGRTAG